MPLLYIFFGTQVTIKTIIMLLKLCGINKGGIYDKKVFGSCESCS